MPRLAPQPMNTVKVFDIQKLDFTLYLWYNSFLEAERFFYKHTESGRYSVDASIS